MKETLTTHVLVSEILSVHPLLRYSYIFNGVLLGFRLNVRTNLEIPPPIHRKVDNKGTV